MANGGVGGPIEGYNSLNEQDAGTSIAAAQTMAAATLSSSSLTTRTTTASSAMLSSSYLDSNYPNPIQYNLGGNKWLEPYFDAATPKNVTALVGKSAYLNCRVRNLGNKTVSNCLWFID